MLFVSSFLPPLKKYVSPAGLSVTAVSGHEEKIRYSKQ